MQRTLVHGHVLVVTGPDLIREGWVKGVTDGLGEEGIRHTIFSGVSPNPRDEEVMNGARIFKEFRV